MIKNFTPLVSLILLFLLNSGAWTSEKDAYYETLIKLETPKKKSKRSEGGEEYVPFRIWIPRDQKVIRGVTFNPFYTKAVTQKHWQSACRLWGFGILSSNFFGVKRNEFSSVIQKALEKFAKESNRPELAQAKIAPMGMSAGAGMSVTIGSLIPNRTVAMGPVCLEVAPKNKASMIIPTMTIFGERDGKQYEKLMGKLPQIRSQGGQFSIACQWRRRHEFARANNLLFPLFDSAIRARMKGGSNKLLTIQQEDGWLGDLTRWREDGTTISTYKEFKGDKSKACWFPDEKTARAWQAFVTRQPKLVLTEPPGLGDGQPFILHHVDDKLKIAGKTKGKLELEGPIEVYIATVKVGTLRDGILETQVKYPGIYPIYLRAKAKDGRTLFARPNTIVVHPKND